MGFRAGMMKKHSAPSRSLAVKSKAAISGSSASRARASANRSRSRSRRRAGPLHITSFSTAARAQRQHDFAQIRQASAPVQPMPARPRRAVDQTSRARSETLDTAARPMPTTIISSIIGLPVSDEIGFAFTGPMLEIRFQHAALDQIIARPSSRNTRRRAFATLSDRRTHSAAFDALSTAAQPSSMNQIGFDSGVQAVPLAAHAAGAVVSARSTRSCARPSRDTPTARHTRHVRDWRAACAARSPSLA
jgi:hypothetical protein